MLLEELVLPHGGVCHVLMRPEKWASLAVLYAVNIYISFAALDVDAALGSSCVAVLSFLFGSLRWECFSFSPWVCRDRSGYTIVRVA